MRNQWSSESIFDKRWLLSLLSTNFCILPINFSNANRRMCLHWLPILFLFLYIASRLSSITIRHSVYFQYPENCHHSCITTSTSIAAAAISAEAIAAASWLIVVCSCRERSHPPLPTPLLELYMMGMYVTYPYLEYHRYRVRSRSHRVQNRLHQSQESQYLVTYMFPVGFPRYPS